MSWGEYAGGGVSGPIPVPPPPPLPTENGLWGLAPAAAPLGTPIAPPPEEPGLGIPEDERPEGEVGPFVLIMGGELKPFKREEK